MTLLGVRLRVWMCAFGLLAGAIGLALAGRDGEDRPARGAVHAAVRPERAAARADGAGSRVLVAGRGPSASRPLPGGAAAGGDASGEAVHRGGRPAPTAALAPRAESGGPGRHLEKVAARPGAPPPRDATVASLERQVERSLSALERGDADAIEAAAEAEVAALEPAPGESPEAFERRREDERGRAVADELLLRARLAELYAQQVYPHGFPVDRIVVPMERQLLRDLPAADRAELLRRLAEGDAPGRPAPSFHPPESGLVYAGGPGL